MIAAAERHAGQPAMRPFGTSPALPISLSSHCIWSRSRPKASQLRRNGTMHRACLVVGIIGFARAAASGCGRRDWWPLFRRPLTRRGQRGPSGFCARGGDQIQRRDRPRRQYRPARTAHSAGHKHRGRGMPAGGVAYGTDRPIRGYPFPGGVSEHGGKIDDASRDTKCCHDPSRRCRQ